MQADGFGRGAGPPLGGSGQELFELPGAALAEVGFPGVQAVQQGRQDHSIAASAVPVSRFGQLGNRLPMASRPTESAGWEERLPGVDAMRSRAIVDGELMVPNLWHGITFGTA